MRQQQPQGDITIQPQDYQARFCILGNHNHETYSAVQIDALNRHHVIISPYSVHLDGTNETETAFVEEMNWWAANAPNVQFLPAIWGIPGGYVWDGVTGTIPLAKRVVGLVKDNNLTNVMGLSFDWESPIKNELGNVTDEPNLERHQAAVQEWKEFFLWMDVNAPEMFLSCINYWEMAQDVVDDDFDLHVRDRYLTYELYCTNTYL